MDRVIGMMLGVVSLTVVLIASVSAQTPDEQRKALVAFYQATSGDEWHNKEGWLSDEGHCQWYGVLCPRDSSDVTILWLSNNNLRGRFPESLAGLSGLKTLVLAGNELTGPLPASLGQMNLRRLDLADNQLEGTIDAAVAAMSLAGVIQLDLAENNFSGPLPDELIALNPVPANGIMSGHLANAFRMDIQPGLNLCGNGFSRPDAELLSFIERHHFGAGFLHCQDPRKPVDPTLSGSRFNPQRSGEGVVQHLLDNGSVLLLWFSHGQGGQVWFQGLAEPTERFAHFDRLHWAEGRFGEGQSSINIARWFKLAIDRELDGRQHMAYSGVVRITLIKGSLDYYIWSQNYEQMELTRLAGATCDSRQPHQWISGAWHDPARSGEGFIMEVNEDGLVVVYWFTYTADDSKRQAWMVGTGEFVGNQVVIDQMIQPVGAEFGTAFDTAQLRHIDWGSLTLQFDDESTGHIWYESNLESYGSGNYPIERLARPMLAECDDGGSEHVTRTDAER